MPYTCLGSIPFLLSDAFLQISLKHLPDNAFKVHSVLCSSSKPSKWAPLIRGRRTPLRNPIHDLTPSAHPPVPLPLPVPLLQFRQSLFFRGGSLTRYPSAITNVLALFCPTKTRITGGASTNYGMPIPVPHTPNWPSENCHRHLRVLFVYAWDDQLTSVIRPQGIGAPRQSAHVPTRAWNDVPWYLID